MNYDGEGLKELLGELWWLFRLGIGIAIIILGTISVILAIPAIVLIGAIVLGVV